MKIVSVSYSKTDQFSKPEDWLKRISFYTGILEKMAEANEVFSIEKINYNGTYKQNGVTYFFLREQNTVERFPFSTHKLVKELNPDIILVNGFIFPLQIIQLRLLIGKRPKIILIHRADKPFNGYKKILQQLADGCVNAYIFSSKEFGEDWVRSGNIKNPNKIFEIVQASSPFKKKNKIESTQMLAISGDPVYLWVGRLEENKDPRTVVKAFVAFLSVQPSAQLYMIYQTEELLQEIKKIIPEQTDRIHLIGKKEHDALETWYNAADFIISGSHNEAVGIAVAEAMSCGCIPIVTDIISFRKIVGNKGLLYTAGDEKALLQQLINSVKIDSEKLSNEVITHFNNELSFEASAKKIEDLAAVLHDK